MGFRNRSKKFVIVGEAQSESGARRGSSPFASDGPSGKRLAEVCGFRDVREFADTLNLSTVVQARAAKGSEFDPSTAVVPDLARYQWVIVCGKRAARFLGLRGLDYFRPHHHAGRAFVVIPHPSPVNRWWNVPENRDRASTFLRELVRN